MACFLGCAKVFQDKSLATIKREAIEERLAAMMSKIDEQLADLSDQESGISDHRWIMSGFTREQLEKVRDCIESWKY